MTWTGRKQSYAHACDGGLLSYTYGPAPDDNHLWPGVLTFPVSCVLCGISPLTLIAVTPTKLRHLEERIEQMPYPDPDPDSGSDASR